MKRKIMLYTITVIVLVNLFVMSVSLNAIKNDYRMQKKNELEILTAIVSKSLDEDGEISLDNFLEDFKIYGVRATLVNEKGEVLYETEDDPVNMYNHKNRPEIQAAYDGLIGMDIRESNTLREEFIYVAMPVENSTYVLRLATSLNNINLSMRGIIVRTVLIILVSMIVASAIIIILVERKFVRPIARLADASAETNDNNLPDKIYYYDSDEIGDLYKKYNIMIDRITDEISHKNETNLFLESILANMSSGVIALNYDRQVVFMNKRSLNILDIDNYEASKNNIINVIRNFEINNFIDDYYKNRKTAAAKFTYDDKILKIIINILPLSQDYKNVNYGAVLLIEDISESYHLEEMRRNFAANVTHELKTPLTSIKGFVETMKNNDIADRKKIDRFLDIIDIEADRLRNLIDDILLLSEMESERPNLEKLYFPDLVNEIKSIMLPIASENNVHIEYDIEEIYFKSNISRIKQLIIIMLDNAIKYNVKDGKVFLHIYAKDDKTIIKIKDTGIGISDEHKERVYERFYRVDKSRSRKKGGTGLGLAIAKHIVMSLDGKIELISEKNKGTEFDIIF